MIDLDSFIPGLEQSDLCFLCSDRSNSHHVTPMGAGLLPGEIRGLISCSPDFISELTEVINLPPTELLSGINETTLKDPVLASNKDFTFLYSIFCVREGFIGSVREWLQSYINIHRPWGCENHPMNKLKETNESNEDLPIEFLWS